MRQQSVRPQRTAEIKGHLMYLAEPTRAPDCKFVGRTEELALCEAAWCVDRKRNQLRTDGSVPLHFRLQGPPGVGKNEIVNEIARRLSMPLYWIQGHEELMPEDLAVLLVPDPELSRSSSMPLVLRLSPLATALRVGGLFFFNEINRVPERALAPLASVLDDQRAIYSAALGIAIEPENEEARKRFRFCCALNPGLSQSGSVLPEYIAQRTLPVVRVVHPPLNDIIEILAKALQCDERFLREFREFYERYAQEEISVRQAIAVAAFALNYQQTMGGTASAALKKSFKVHADGGGSSGQFRE